MAIPYEPQHINGNVSYNKRSMWSARWGHTLTVINDTSYTRNDLSTEENADRIASVVPILVIVGGDDYGTTFAQKRMHNGT